MQALTDFLNNQPAWHWWALGARAARRWRSPARRNICCGPASPRCWSACSNSSMPPLDGRLAVFLFAVISRGGDDCCGSARRLRPGRTHTAITISTSAARNMSAAMWWRWTISHGGRGAVRVDDSRWNAMTTDGSSPAKGAALEVTGSDGTTLMVKAA